MRSLNNNVLGAAVVGRWTRVGEWNVFSRSSVASEPSRIPEIVLVHGIAVSSRYMLPALERLGREFTAHALDLPGFGRSDKPREPLTPRQLADSLGAWLDANRIHSAILVGHSYGCQIVADFVARHPHRSAGVVLASPTVDSAHRSMIGELARLLLDATRENPGVIPLNVADYFRAGLGRALRTLKHAVDDRIEDKIPRIPPPLLFVRGSRDPIVTRDWVERLTSVGSSAELVTIDGAAHALNYSAAREFAEIVGAFARRGRDGATVLTRPC